MSTSSGPERRIGTLELPPDAPRDVVALLSRAAGPATEAELADETAAVAAFVAQRTTAPAPRRRLPVRTVRVAAATLTMSIVLGGGLAAADVLPTPAQRWVSRALDVVGIRVPSADHPASAAGSPASSTGRGPMAAAANLPARETVPPPMTGPARLVPAGHLVVAPGGSANGAAGAGATETSGQARTGGAGTGVAGTSSSHRSAHGESSAGESGSGAATHGSESPRTSSTAGSKAKGYGAGGNPAHSNSSGGQQTSAGSPAHGKPADSGASAAAHSSAPGQTKKSSGAANGPAAG